MVPKQWDIAPSQHLWKRSTLAARDNSISEVHQCNDVTDINEISVAVYFKGFNRSYVCSNRCLRRNALRTLKWYTNFTCLLRSVPYASYETIQPFLPFQDDMISTTSVPLIHQDLSAVCLRIRSAMIDSIRFMIYLFRSVAVSCTGSDTVERVGVSVKYVGMAFDTKKRSTFLGQMGFGQSWAEVHKSENVER